MKIMKQAGIFLLIFSILVSCKNKAIEFNNNLVKIQQSVLPQVQAFAKKMEQTSKGTITLKDLSADAKKMVVFIDKKIAEASALPVENGGEDLKNAIIDQLKFERNICYKTGVLGNEQTSEEEKNVITQEFMSSEADGQKLEERVTQTQKEYAKKNNFKLEKK